LSPVGKQITLSQQEYIQLKWNSNYWEAQHKRACEREAVLKQELKHEKAKVRYLNQRLFGKKTEKGTCKSEQSKDCPSDDTDDKQRLKQWDPSLSLAKQSAAFQVCHQALESAYLAIPVS
jgi:hypothetical protein